jgi:MEDS: MEthanogen/methylotroph, DcmR Sensory domain
VSNKSIDKGGCNIQKLLPLSEVVSQISTMASGEHNILVYADLPSFGKIYAPFCKQRLEDNDIALMLTYYETIGQVKANLHNSGIDVQGHAGRGNLIVADAIEELFGQGKDFLSFLVSLEKKVKELGKNCVSVIVSMSAFMLYERTEELLEYEGLLDLAAVRNWKVLCCYDRRDYDTLKREQQEQLLEHHNRKLLCSGH